VTSRYPGGPAAREAARGTELALYRLGQRANGTAVLEKLVEQHPTSAFAADAQFQIAKRRYQEKNWTGAADAFRQVVSRFPGYSAADQAQFLLGDALEKAGDRDGARLAQEQFLSYFPESSLRPTVDFRLGLGQFEAKEYAQASVSFTRVLAESASVEVRSAARYNLALCTRLLGDVEGARTALEAYRASSRTTHAPSRSPSNSATSTRRRVAAGGDPRVPGRARRELEARARGGAVLPHRPLQGVAGRHRRSAPGVPAGDDGGGLPRRPIPPLGARALRGDLGGPPRLRRALDAYRDIAQSSRDREIAQAAAGRASQLEASVPKKKR